MQLRGQRGITAILRQPVERTDERLLCEILRQITITREPIRQPIDAIDVRVVQRTFRRSVAGEASRHELLVSHDVAVLAMAVLVESGIATA